MGGAGNSHEGLPNDQRLPVIIAEVVAIQAKDLSAIHTTVGDEQDVLMLFQLMNRMC
jgi:hypothetical protein